MTPGTLAARVTLCLAAASAVRLWRASPSHAPVAVALCLAASLDLARPYVLGPLWLARALYVAFPILSAALALATAAPPRARHVAAAAALTWIVIASCLWASPPSQDAFLELTRLCAVLALLVQSAGAIAILAPGRLLNVGSTAVLLLVAADLAVVLTGPWAHLDPRACWELARYQYAIGYGTIAAIQLWRIRWIQQTLAVTQRPGSSPSPPLRH